MICLGIYPFWGLFSLIIIDHPYEEVLFNDQQARKGISDSSGLAYFAWLIEFSSLLAHLTSEVFWGNLNYTRTLINPAHQQMFCRLVKMTIDSTCTC